MVRGVESYTEVGVAASIWSAPISNALVRGRDAGTGAGGEMMYMR